MKKLLATIAVSAALGMSQGANAALVNSDFLIAGDDYLVTDTVTGLEWLTPYYTRGLGYNGSLVQNLIANYGFRYASGQETYDMITGNFSPTPSAPGNAAGYQVAEAFYDVFGINSSISHCNVAGTISCASTLGFTATPVGTTGHLSYGMNQYGSNGYLQIVGLPDDFLYDEVGSWLVRLAEEGPAQVPAPPTLWLALLGLAGLVSFRKKLG